MSGIVARCLAGVCALALLGGGCAVDDPSICGVGAREIVIFPSGSLSVPTNTVVRVVLGADPSGVTVRLIDLARDLREPGTLAVFDTSYGAVIELVPDLELAPNTTYRVEIVDEASGVDVVAAGSFTTRAGPETAAAAGGAADASITPIAGEDRACCTGAGCRDGTVLDIASIGRDNFVPQLVLVTVDRLENDACGPVRVPVGVIPVVWDSEVSAGSILSAETDYLLDGCFEIAAVTQTLRVTAPIVACTPGASFTPAGPTEACGQTRDSGCQGGGGGVPGILGGVLALAAWMARRRYLGVGRS